MKPRQGDHFFCAQIVRHMFRFPGKDREIVIDYQVKKVNPDLAPMIAAADPNARKAYKRLTTSDWYYGWVTNVKIHVFSSRKM